MSKFVFFNYGEGYQKCILNAVKNEADVFCFSPFTNSFIKKLFLYHNAWPLNKTNELPFKKIWFKRCLKDICIKRDEEIFFLFFESFHMTYSCAFLKYLKKTYQKAKFFYIFSNPANAYNISKLMHINRFIDYTVTFFEDDAKKYGFQYCCTQPYKVPEISENEFPESDVFFVGSDKGRLEKLLSIYEQLTNAGLKCDFHIVDVDKKKQKYADSIIYNKKISYEEVLKRVCQTKCVLEVLQNDCSYLSIRTTEAMQYHKKLLTTSKASQKQSFYNPEIIQIITDFENINTDFVTQRIDDSLFPDSTFGSFEAFKSFLLAF